MPGHWVAKQVRCVYGTRDAGALWEDTYRAALEGMEFKSGVASPCIFSHADRDLVCVVHGDDFTTLENDDNINWYEAELAKHFELKLRGRLGCDCPGDNEIRILNRIIRITDRGLEYETDPRYVEVIVESVQLQDSKPVTSPGVKNPDSSTEAATKDDDPSTSATVQAGLEPGEMTSDETLEPEHLLDLLHALTSDNYVVFNMSSTTKSAKSVTFSDAVDYVSVFAYAEVYGFLPHD